MSLRSYLDHVELVKTGPSPRERLEQWTQGRYHKALVGRLRRFRQRLEREMHPVPWTGLDAPMVLLLHDVCDALDLGDTERAAVLGPDGEKAFDKLFYSRPVPVALINDRQAKALAHIREHGAINLSDYRKLCPGLSDESLRLDLADLVRREVLTRSGRNKGTLYTLAA